jgi:hypothetical protein
MSEFPIEFSSGIEIGQPDTGTAKRYLVDLPDFTAFRGDPDCDTPWINVRNFETREEAIAWCKLHLGADDEGRVNLISEVEEVDGTA